jgi:UDP-N-acetylmuramoyl-tripeptide--D-alanyl-D-alanine ligase
MTISDLTRLLPLAKLSHQTQSANSVEIKKFVTDSRAVNPGDFFVAIKGERFDANEFVADVATQGALGALVSYQAKQVDMPAWAVPDTLVAMQSLAKDWRAELPVKVVIVTGSNGKTTVKEMIASIFSEAAGQEESLSTKGNFNNEIGLPLTLLRLNRNHQLATIELGMNHPGETKFLANIAKPDIALINNAQREHQEFMHGVEAVALEHAHAIDALDAHGIAVFPADSEYSTLWRERAANREVIDFAFNATKQSEVVVCGSWLPSGEIHVVINRQNHGLQEFSVKLNTLGEHNAKNALAATAVAIGAGISIEKIKLGLEKFTPVSGRMQSKPLTSYKGSGLLIDDTYNANPDSVIAAIDVLAGLNGIRWLALGDMGEVGSNGPEFHKEIGDYARQKGINCLFATGDLTQESVKGFNGQPAGGDSGQSSKEGAWHFADSAHLTDALLSRMKLLEQESNLSDLSILVKGSRFTKMERVVNNLLEEKSACC